MRYVHHPRRVQAAGVSALPWNLDSVAIIVNPNRGLRIEQPAAQGRRQEMNAAGIDEVLPIRGQRRACHWAARSADPLADPSYACLLRPRTSEHPNLIV